jgi:hypothetical protein
LASPSLRLLTIPAVVGMLLSLYRASSSANQTILSVAMPLFNVFLCVWGTLLLEGWKRANASLAYKWGIFNRPDVYTKPNEVNLQPTTNSHPPTTRP